RPATAPPAPAARQTIGAVRQRAPRDAGGAPPAPAADPPPAAAATVAIPGLDRDELTRVWGDVIFPAMAPGVRSVFRTGRWTAVDGATAVFAFEHPQFLQRGEEKRADVEAALGAHFGAPVGLRLVLDPGAGGTPGGPGAPPSSARRAPAGR